MGGEPVFGDETYRAYLAALLAGDHRFCSQTVSEVLDAGAAPRLVHVGLFRRSLYDVGHSWERNRISVAAEHLASAITERLLNQVLLESRPAARVGRTVVIAGIAPELHHIGAKIVADTFELAGWDSHFVGSNTPTADLVRHVVERSPDLLGLSLTGYSNLSELERGLESILEVEPGQPILLGGQGLRRVGPRLVERYPSAVYCSTLEELDQRMSALSSPPESHALEPMA